MTKTHIFEIDFYSEEAQRNYTGIFTCKKLSIRDIARVSAEKIRLNGGLYFDQSNPGYGVDEGTDNFNTMLAHLTIALINTPDWWDLDEISDPNLVVEVFREVTSFENSFLERRKVSKVKSARTTTDGETDSTKDDTGSGHDSNLKDVVGGKVSTALEP